MKFRANGKLLLSGEYLVLKGARALAIPTSFGQELEVTETSDGKLSWSSTLKSDNIFKAEFSLDGSVLTSSEQMMANRLSQILKAILKIKRETIFQSTKFQASLEFPLDWGLGSSSTLVYNLACWSKVDPLLLNGETFGGSGYDLICAASDLPIYYELSNGKPIWEKIQFAPDFSEKLYFIHLNQKMNSRDSIAKFNALQIKSEADKIAEISLISNQMSLTNDVNEFSSLMDAHEEIISEILDIPTVKSRLFKDYNGAIKSLGAWGGDFIMAVGGEDEMSYFMEKGFGTIIPFNEMALTANLIK